MILEHPERPYTLEFLASQAFMSRSMFAQRFATCFDRSPMAFAKGVRIRRAAALLQRTDMAIEDIASRVGFASRSHFSRAFRESFGQSPGRFRIPGRRGALAAPSASA
jgi:AraC family transcriptional regulator, activator of mtrCDE